MRSWCCRTIVAGPGSPQLRSSSAPTTEWVLMMRNSSSSSGPGLVEDGVGHRELADVVQPRSDPQVVEPSVVEVERTGDLHGQDRDVEAVADRVGVLLVQQLEADLAPRGRQLARGLVARDARAVLAAALGRVERGVGAGQQLVAPAARAPGSWRRRR